MTGWSAVLLLLAGAAVYALAKWYWQTSKEEQDRRQRREHRTRALAAMTSADRLCFLREERRQEDLGPDGFDTPYNWPAMTPTEQSDFRSEQVRRNGETGVELDRAAERRRWWD